MKRYLVERELIQNNIQVIRKKAGSAVIWAVLKGDGYGLGLLPMAEVCREAGLDHFAVTEIAEARALREGGFETEPILMLQPTADAGEIAQLLPLHVIFTISSSEDASVLAGLAAQAGVTAEAHLKLDTGMGRYGFLPEEMEKITPVYHYMDTIHVTGIYTHLHSAFCDKKATKAQIESFNRVLAALREAGIEPGMAHVLNSSGVLHFSGAAMDAVRVGSALLGRVRGGHGLKRVGYCETQVEELKWLPKGHTTGYGAGWRARKPTRIAILPVGWYNGFGCEMGNDLFRFRDCLRNIASNLRTMLFGKAYYVTVNGKRCKVLGHIGMLHTAVDVSSISCSLGTPVRMEINPLMQKGMEVVWQ